MKCPFDKKLPVGRECLQGKTKQCPWWVLNAKARYCMWNWINTNPGLVPYNLIGEALGKTGARIHQEIQYKILPKVREFFKE